MGSRYILRRPCRHSRPVINAGGRRRRAAGERLCWLLSRHVNCRRTVDIQTAGRLYAMRILFLKIHRNRRALFAIFRENFT